MSDANLGSTLPSPMGCSESLKSVANASAMSRTVHGDSRLNIGYAGFGCVMTARSRSQRRTTCPVIGADRSLIR